VASNLYPPSSVVNIFSNWLRDIDLKDRILIWVEAVALLWSVWLCGNDMAFNSKIRLICRTRVIFSVLTNSDHGISSKTGTPCSIYEGVLLFEQVVKDIFLPYGWRHSLWIGPHVP
jgi:hypothetical protein